LGFLPIAGVAQLVEQLIRNQQVIGSSPIAGSKDTNKLRDLVHKDREARLSGVQWGSNL
jgi:hypothetical protein